MIGKIGSVLVLSGLLLLVAFLLSVMFGMAVSYLRRGDTPMAILMAAPASCLIGVVLWWIEDHTS